MPLLFITNTPGIQPTGAELYTAGRSTSELGNTFKLLLSLWDLPSSMALQNEICRKVWAITIFEFCQLPNKTTKPKSLHSHLSFHWCLTSGPHLKQPFCVPFSFFYLHSLIIKRLGMSLLSSLAFDKSGCASDSAEVLTFQDHRPKPSASSLYSRWGQA